MTKEDTPAFEGTWKGIAAIAYRAWVYLKIEQTASGYKATGHVTGATGVKEYALLKGEVKEGKLFLSVVDYSQNDPVGNDVFEAYLVLEPIEDKLKLQFRKSL